MIKWFTAILGGTFFGFPGAILGFFLGIILDQSGTFSETTFSKKVEVTPKDFELNLLSLCSIIIKADGNVNQTELNYVRQYFVNTYGKEKANATFRTFNEIVKNRLISSQHICQYLNQHTRYPSRLQIVHFLFGIANADGHVSIAEAEEIQKISSFLKIRYRDFESIKAMFFKSEDHAYKILEIDKNATDAEVKKAFRNMAKKYHPDKLQHMDDVYKKGAEEKFRAVQTAYDQIKKERGIN